MTSLIRINLPEFTINDLTKFTLIGEGLEFLNVVFQIVEYHYFWELTMHVERIRFGIYPALLLSQNRNVMYF